MEYVDEALVDIAVLVEFAFEQGFHELGYNPLAVVCAALGKEVPEPARAQGPMGCAVEEELDRESVDRMPAPSAPDSAAKGEKMIVNLFGWRVCISTPAPRMQVSPEFARIQDPDLVARTNTWMTQFYGCDVYPPNDIVKVSKSEGVLMMNESTWARLCAVLDGTERVGWPRTTCRPRGTTRPMLLLVRG